MTTVASATANQYLLDESPISFYPGLAVILGNVNKALILQQLHYLLGTQKTSNNEHNFVDGHWWVYNSYPQWQEKWFPWLSISAIKKLFRELEKDGVVKSKQGVKSKSDRRKWYRIDYIAYGQKVSDHETKNVPSDETKNVPSMGQNLSDVYIESKNTSKNTSENVEPEKPAATVSPVKPPTVQEKSPEPTPDKEEKAVQKKRYDAIAKAIMKHLHGIEVVPKEQGFMWKTVHKQAKEAASIEWLEAGHIEKFIHWYKKENRDAALPSSLEGFSIWLTKYAATRPSQNGSTPHKPDPNCPVCRGAGTVITKRGSITEPAEYGKCPACMVKGEKSK